VCSSDLNNHVVTKTRTDALTELIEEKLTWLLYDNQKLIKT
jgi:hypothetical protein